MLRNTLYFGLKTALKCKVTKFYTCISNLEKGNYINLYDLFNSSFEFGKNFSVPSKVSWLLLVVFLLSAFLPYSYFSVVFFTH